MGHGKGEVGGRLFENSGALMKDALCYILSTRKYVERCTMIKHDIYIYIPSDGGTSIC